MRYLVLLLSVISIFIIGCGGDSGVPKTNTNSGGDTSSINKPTATPVLNTQKTPETAKTGEAPTISPAIDGYYGALAKRDEASAKKFLSANALKYYETEAKSEKKTWFAYVLEENDPISEKREVRNEKIEGEKAVAELKGGNLGVWTPIAFVKENGEWKIASPDENIKLSNIQKTETLTNKAK